MASSKARVLYEWASQDDTQLNISVGQIITVYPTADDTASGWMYAENTSTGIKGYVPANYVEVMSAPAPPAARPPPSTSAPAVSTSASSSTTKSVFSSSLSAFGGNRGNRKEDEEQKQALVEKSTVSSSPFSKFSSSSSSSASSSSSTALSPRAPVSESQVGVSLRPVAAAAAAASSSSSSSSSSASSSYSSSNASKPAAAPAASAAKKVKFHHLAWNMGMISGWATFILGIFAIVEAERALPVSWMYVGGYAIIIGWVSIITEYFFWQERTASRIPWRTIFYFVISIYQFWTLPTALSGVCCIMTAFVNFCSERHEEEITLAEKDQPITKLVAWCRPELTDSSASAGQRAAGSGGAGRYAADADEDRKLQQQLGEDASCCDRIVDYYMQLRREAKVGRYLFYLAYFIANVIVFAWFAAQTKDALDATEPEKRLTYYIVAAKGFGHMLNMNCAFIVIPMLRACLRYLYNRSTMDQRKRSKFVRAILLFIPVDFSITIHKMIAGYIFFAFAGHSIAHLLNYGVKPTLTIEIMGWWALISGFMLLFISFIMYSASFDNVKTNKFEWFWYAHHLFVAFFLITLLHGRTGFGPNFWKWFIAPGACYLCERIYRYFQSTKDVTLMSISFMNPNVIALEFAKSGPFEEAYQEGQYIFLLCPAVSDHQWHPFTISSAPSEQSVTLHIRTWGPLSWTKRVAEYLATMGPKDASFIRFNHMSEAGNTQGKVLGPDGKPLFQVDGPHAAPTQHAKEYKTVMVVGGGIGVTPLAATMKEVIFNRWKYAVGKSFPDRVTFVWMCAYTDLDSFRWFFRCVKECHDAFADLEAKNQSMKTKFFEFHIFVTSAPRDRNPDSLRSLKPKASNDDEDISMWGRHARKEIVSDQMQRTANAVDAGYSEYELFKTAKLLEGIPTGQFKDMGNKQRVKIWNGRPNWDSMFSQLVEQAKANPDSEAGDFSIGVTACANPMICSDLEQACAKYSMPEHNRFVILHKENF